MEAKSRFLRLKWPKENRILGKAKAKTGKANLVLPRENVFPGKENFLLGASTFFPPGITVMRALAGFSGREKNRILEKQLWEREKKTWVAGKKRAFWKSGFSFGREKGGNGRMIFFFGRKKTDFWKRMPGNGKRKLFFRDFLPE